MKTHQGLKKRFKLSKPKKGTALIKRQSKGRGSKHLKTKKSNPRKRRINKTKDFPITKNLKRILKTIKS